MNRGVMFFLAATGFALLLSATPATAQNQGQGNGQGPLIHSEEFCTLEHLAQCPLVLAGTANPQPLVGACVSFRNTCENPGQYTYPGRERECCTRCLVFAAVCGLSREFCRSVCIGL